MKNKRKALKITAEKLKSIPWAIFSGTAVEIYSKGKRKGNDIDIIVSGDKIDEVGGRFNAKPVLETREKGGIKIVNDYHIETIVDGIPVEFVGKTEKLIIDGEVYKSTQDLKRRLFRKVKKKKYLGVNVFVVPVEEILTQKMIFDRSGKWQDRDDVKLLLEIENINKQSLIRAFDRWGVSKKKQKIFLEKLIKI